MADRIIETDDLIKEYRMGGRPLLAVRDVSVAVARGEFVAIMDASIHRPRAATCSPARTCHASTATPWRTSGIAGSDSFSSISTCCRG